jgi:hypothetical protein
MNSDLWNPHALSATQEIETKQIQREDDEVGWEIQGKLQN